MISVNDLRQGVLFNYEGRVYQVLEFQRHKQARAKGVVNVKGRDVETAGVREITFNSAASVEEADAVSKQLDFVFFDARKNKLIFSEPESKKRLELDQGSLDAKQVGFLVSGIKITALMSSDDLSSAKIYSITIPTTVELEVVEAPPSDKGDTASGGTKPVKVSTGITVNTPFFIKVGDKIKVNTQSGEYLERV